MVTSHLILMILSLTSIVTLDFSAASSPLVVEVEVDNDPNEQDALVEFYLDQLEKVTTE